MARSCRALRVWPVACILATAALLVATVPGSAFFQSANVVITADKSAYSVGDFANLTMRVFSFGSLTDPASITLRLNPSTNVTRLVSVTRQAVGTYNATFQIEPADVGPVGPYSMGSVAVQVSAGVDSLADVENTSLFVLPQHVLGFTMAASALEAAPGATVQLSLQITADGVPRDASQISITALASSGVSSVGPIVVSVANVSTGNYTASYQVPADLAPPAVVSFNGVATVAGVNLSRYAYVYVPGAQPFQIWAYQSVFLPPTVLFSVFVGDSAGGFVAGANVSLNYTYSAAATGFLPVTKAAASVTDAYGRAAFSLNLSGSPDVFDVTYRGNATKGSNRQAFSGVLYAPPAGPTATFQIVRTNPYAFFDVNETAELNYTVLAVGHPVAGAKIYYYAQTDLAFLAAGNATTDGSGDITLAVPIRAGVVRVLLTASTGSTWYSMTDSVTPAHPLAVQTDPIRIGTAVRVNVTFPYPGTWYASVSLAPYVPSTVTSPWQAVSGFFGPASPFQEGAKVSYNVSLPQFLPKDTDYLLYVYATPAFASISGGAGGLYGLSQLIHITNVPAQVRANLSTTSPAVGDAVTVDASSSRDPDGFIVGYRVAWGDGLVTDWAASPSFSHSYSAAGDYRISVSVQDDTGAVSVTQTTVHVESTILGLRSSIAIPLLAAGSAVVAILAVVWWRRRRRSPETVALAETTPAPPPTPGDFGDPRSKP